MDFSNCFVSECREYSSYVQHVKAPVFRKSFVLKEGSQSGEILICGLGFYDLFINGEKITKGYLAPYISNTDHIVYYDHYDLTPWLKAGENVIGVMLGDGFQNSKTRVWDFMDNVFNSAPKLALSMKVESDGEKQEFDAMDFSCKKGPIFFNDLRSGVFFDKREEEKGWDQPGFQEDENWHKPILADRPRGKAKLCEAEPIAVVEERKPVKIWKGALADYTPRGDVPEGLCGQTTPESGLEKEGGYIYDFGENNAGIFRLKIKGHKGQRIDIQCGELLENGALSYQNIYFYPDGYSQRDIYIVGSEEEETFEPMFTYHGYRYLYVTGIEEEQATEDLFTYLVMSSDLENRGSFECSDKLANEIYHIARVSDRANFYYFPTDCPHREKNGWTGDAQISAEHMILTMGAEKSWKEWLNNIRLAQDPMGRIPGIIPTGDWGFAWGNGPAWDKVLFELPYIIYKYRGDTEPIKENAHAMMSYLEYVSRQRDENGIIAIGLGDWVPVDRAADDYVSPLGFTDTVMVYLMCREAEVVFDKTGLSLNRDYAVQFGRELREAIRNQYLDLNRMLVKSSCQTAQALAIYYDIFDTGEKPEAFRRLMEIIHRDGDKMNCGFLGLRVMFHVLSDYGEAELAYRMITGPSYPSYGYFVEAGETSMPEMILSDMKYRNASLNHHFLCDVVQWYMKYPGGIHVENSKKVLIRPTFISSLTYAKASHQLPDGEVSVYWKREGERIYLEVKCPDTVSCELMLDQDLMIEDSKKPYLEKGQGCWYLASCR